MTKPDFYDDHKNGRHNWYVLIIGILLIWLFSYIIPFVLTYFFLDWWQNSNISIFVSNKFVFAFPTSLFLYIVSTLPFVLGIWIIQRKLRQRPIGRLNNAFPALGFRWKRALAGILAFAAIMTLSWVTILLLLSFHDVPSPAEQIGFPKDTSYQIITNPVVDKFKIMAAVILLPFIVLNAWVQEMSFRGFLDQGLTRYFRDRFAVFLISSFVFALWHIMPSDIIEAIKYRETSRLYVFILNMMVFGFLMSILTAMDGGIEAAVGIHLANNFYHEAMYSPLNYALNHSDLTTKFNAVQFSLLDLLENIIFFTLALTILAFWKLGLADKSVKP